MSLVEAGLVGALFSGVCGGAQVGLGELQAVSILPSLCRHCKPPSANSSLLASFCSLQSSLQISVTC